MIPPYLLCDICGKKIKLGTSLHIETNGYLDSDSDWIPTFENMDLCPKHLKELIETYLNHKDGKTRHKNCQEFTDTYHRILDRFQKEKDNK